MKYQINIATTKEEKEEIYKFRYRVYIDELKKIHLPANHQTKQMYDNADEYAALYYVKIEENIIATVRAIRGVDGSFLKEDIDFFYINTFEKYFQHNEIAIVNRLIIDKPYRHTSLIQELFLATYLGGLQVGTKLCFVTCDSLLYSFYLKYGFRSYQEPVEIKKNEKRYLLLLVLCDLQHLISVKSPFISHLPVNLDDNGKYAKVIESNLCYSMHVRKVPIKDKVLLNIFRVLLKIKSMMHHPLIKLR